MLRNWQGNIITSFLYPTSGFNFDEFYDRLNGKAFVIYPGKVTKADCFLISHIGHLFPRGGKRDESPG